MTKQPKWKDSRVYKPPSNHYDRYAVLFLASGIVMSGYAAWMPRDGYKDGDWIDITTTNGNKMSVAKVLYWHDFLIKPQDVEL